jgi:gluconokinase
LKKGPLVLAIDVGTSSVRAILYDFSAGELKATEAQLTYQPRLSAGGRAEVPVSDLTALVGAAIDRCLDLAGPDSGRIAAVGVSTFWHGLVALDGGGRALTGVILWSDTRAWAQSERLRATLDAEAVRQRTGAPIHPSFWPAKLAWLREAEPDLWQRAKSFASFGDIFYRRLFGSLGTSLSMASGTGLLRLDGSSWDQQLLDVLDVPQTALPVLANVETGLRPEFAGRWPSLATVPWLHAFGDGALANLGSGCTEPSQRALTVGTSGALRVLAGQRPKKLPPGLWCYRLDGRRYVTGGALSNGGNLYAWLLRTLRVEPRGLEARLARMRPASTGLTFLPLLAGERSPGFAAKATGAIGGLTQATTAEQIVRAGLEAVAVEFAQVDRALDQLGWRPAERLVASGGGLLGSPAWMQIMADVIGKPVAASRAQEASSQGAAVMALEHLGGAPARKERLGHTFEPRRAAHLAYRETVRRQQALYDALIGERILDSPGKGAHLEVEN